MVFGGENAESYYDEGVTASMRGDVARAVECFEKAIAFDQDFSAAFHQLGKCYLRLGDAQRASGLLAKLVSRKPNLSPARVDLGMALLSMNRPEEARPHFEQVLARQPQHGRATLGMAQAAYQQGDWPTAVAYARKACDIGGQGFASLFMLGRAAKMAGDTALSRQVLEEAEGILEKTVELNPDAPDAYYLRGEVRFTLDEFPKALEYYRQAEDRADRDHHYLAFGEAFDYEDILVKQAFCYQRLGAMDRAREVGQRILKDNPDSKQAKLLAGLEGM